MNRSNKIPCCSRCTTNYHIGDVNGSKVPMLLPCGHDMCRSCIRFMYRKNKQVICELCRSDSMIKCDDELSNIPIHYFIVGKVWYLLYDKKLKIYKDISNLRMKNLSPESLIKTKENCQTCQKYATVFCQQCNEIYCEDCSEEFHNMDNQIMSQHDLKKLDTAHLELFKAFKCDLHLKSIDFICVTCERQMCSICAVEHDRNHDIQHLEKYYAKEVQHLNEYLLKGDILLKRLKHYRNKFNEKVQKRQCYNLKKNKSFDQKKRLISTYVSSVIGALQCLEQQLFYMMDQAEQSTTNSMIQVVGQLTDFIEKLQTKLNIVDVVLKNHQYSSTAMMDQIADIESLLDTTYYLAKKNITNPSIKFNFQIFKTIQQSVIFDIDLSNRYILECSPDLLPEYTLSAMIGLNSDDNMLAERSPSSVSSMYCSSNYSTISGETISASGDAAVSSSEAIANSDDAFISSDSVIASSVNSPSQTQAVKEIVRTEVEPVIVTHINSPSDFFLQLIANKGVLDMVEDELDKHVKSECGSVPVDHVEMDNTIYAIQTSADEWHRGVVLHSYNENGKNLFRVYFVDYGFMKTLTADRMRSVPPSVVSIPSLAYNCALYDLKPKSTTGWSNEAYILFNDLMLAKTGSYFVYPLKLNSKRIEVDVVWNEDIYPLSVRDAMFFLGHGSYEYYVNKELHEQLVKMITLPDSLKLDEKKKYSVVLCHFISPTEFYLRINDDTAQLDEVMNTLKTLYTPTAKNTHKSYLLYTPQIGMAVAARYSIDGHWYRARITSLPEARLVTVFYIDFGNSETLPWDELRVLNKELIKTPPLAIKASLVDVCPAVDGIECTKWSDNAYAAFLKFAKVDYAEDNLIAFVHEVDGDTHKIVLYNCTSRTEICLNSKLVSQGYATTMDPGSCVFKKTNTRKQMKQPVLPLNSRNKEVILPLDDTLSFIKQRSVTENENHDWKNKNKINKLPGVPMSIIKVISPDEIILKKVNYNTEKLTEYMNKVYSNKKKKTQKLSWKKNDLCAIFINKYGNWYRGKIINLNITQQMVTIYLYDLNEMIDQIPIKTLHILEENCANEICGILHCGLSGLVPLGASDGVWPKFSCDRLIEELKKYPIVYFSRTNSKEQNIALGNLWIKEIEMPRALEPLRERWINMNRFMIQQGFALNKKQNMKDDEYSDSQSESEFNYSIVSIKSDKFVNRWLPPARLVKSQLNAVISYVDMECHIYLQNLDDETPQLLQLVSNELNEVFSNSQPEPINIEWSEGQSVIVQYHLDNMWYRGTIIKINEIEEKLEFSVQFCDYGNIETCMHENLRSTLYMTDVPQLCVKGYFSTILPITKDRKWPISTLDFIHSMIVERQCMVVIDESLSTDDIYAVKYLKEIQEQLDVCQYLVTNKMAYFEYLSTSIIELMDMDKKKKSDATYNNYYNDDDGGEIYDDDIGEINDNGEQTYNNIGETNNDDEQTYNDIGETNNDSEQTYNNIRETNNDDEQIYNNIGETNNDDEQTYNDIGETNNDSEQTYNNIRETNNDDEQIYNNIGDTNNDSEQTYDDIGEINDNGKQTYNDIGETNNDSEQTYDDIGEINDNGKQIYNDIGETNNDDEQIYNNIGDTNKVYESTYDNRSMAGHSVDNKRWNSVDALSSALPIILDDEEESGFSKFCLETNEVFEGTMCRITGPTSLMLVITKIGDADLSVSKNRMYNEMYNKCGTLPPLDHIVPGHAVTVIHNGLWKRGVIEDDGNSVFLVDFGTSIKLIKKNLRPCPVEFFQMPMFTIDCQLENVRLGDDADAKEVVNKLSKTLRGINLKIVGISESDKDIIGVELYNSKEEIAYQPLIDAKLLIPA